jgi:hypothetical protein
MEVDPRGLVQKDDVGVGGSHLEWPRINTLFFGTIHIESFVLCIFIENFY